MSALESPNSLFVDSFCDEYFDIMGLLTKKIFNHVDKDFTLRIYYHIFLDRMIIMKGTEIKKLDIVTNLIFFFNSYCKLFLVWYIHSLF